jgi:hypothetical protein
MHHATRLLLPAACAAVVAACGGGGSSSSADAEPGVLRVSLTDAPACGYDAVNVTVEKLRVHRSAGAADADAGWHEIVLPTPRRFDLLTLTNGVIEELGETALPSGTYTQLRLVLAPNGGSAPYANSVVPTGGSEVPLTTPSGQQSGLKLNVNLTVQPNQVADFVLDFDACKSVVPRGASGQYNLKPVISVIPRLGDAGQRVVGYVDPALAGAAVSVQSGGVPVKATVPAADGRFVLYPVPAGDYDLVVTASGRVTAVMTGVPVTTTAITTLNSAALPITPPATVLPLRAVTGTVTPATASVRATQTLAGGKTIEVQAPPVDAVSGGFAFALPVEPPVRLAYSAAPAALPFVPDTLALGLYTVEADAAGVKKSVQVDTNAAVAPLTIAFP